MIPLLIENLPIAMLLLVGIVSLVGGLWLLRRLSTYESNIASIVYSLTHDELANPIQSALSTVENLEQKNALQSSDSINDIVALKKSLIRLTNVTKNLRTLALLDTANTAAAKERVNLVGLVQGLIAEVGDRAEKDSVRLVYEGGDSPIYILAKPLDLERLLSNLLDNGIKYKNPEAESCVVISVSKTKRKACIVVSDNGVGISPERLITLTEQPQKPDAKNFGTRGAGLGLYLSRKVVESNRGSLRIDSAVQKGTTVTIEMPLLKGGG